MNYLVIIADIIESKKLADRKNVQSLLKKELIQINNKSKDLISPFTITLGDEFQAVYINGNSLLRDLIHVIVKLYPVRIRFSVGYGLISTEINRDAALGMDGPAFYQAREGMSMLKKGTYTLIKFFNLPLKCDYLINSSLNLFMSIMADWKQNTLYIFYELLQNKSVKEIAETLGISERAIYKTVTIHRLRNFVDYFSALEIQIRSITSV